MKMDITKLLFCKVAEVPEKAVWGCTPTLNITYMSNVIKQEKTEEEEKRNM